MKEDYKLQIFARFNNKTILIDLLPNDKIIRIKNDIMNKNNITNSNILYITWNGRIINEELTICDYDIQKHQTVNVLVRAGTGPITPNYN